MCNLSQRQKAPIKFTEQFHNNNTKHNAEIGHSSALTAAAASHF